MSIQTKKNRLRSNTELLNLYNHSRHSFLVESEFESTRLKLEMLRKFERTMLSQTQTQSGDILGELRAQNKLLTDINEILEARKRISFVTEAREHDGSSMVSDQTSKYSSVQNSLGEIQEDWHGENDRPTSPHVIRPCKKKNTIGEYVISRQVRPTLHRSSSLVGKSKLNPRWLDLTQSTCIGSTISSNDNKSKLSSSTQPSFMEGYLRTKERELIKRELAVCKLQKSFLDDLSAAVNNYAIQSERQQELTSKLSQQRELMLKLVTSLISTGCLLTEEQLQLVQQLSTDSPSLPSLLTRSVSNTSSQF